MIVNKDISKCIQIYKEQLEKGYIQEAYIALTKYVSELRTKFQPEFTTGNISYGYLDYTYFPYVNAYVREAKLRFGIVLNHEKMQFEVWLMGQNAVVQKEYWNILKNTKWNEHRHTMPKYSVLEVCLENNIDFGNKEEMTVSIVSKAKELSKEIQLFLEKQIC